MGRIDVGVLGRISASLNGSTASLGGPRQQALLAVLVAQVGQTVSVDALIDAVWEGDPPSEASTTFRSYVARLRRAIGELDGQAGEEVVVTDPGGYRLDASRVRVDAREFERSVAQARDALTDDGPERARDILEDALAGWTGRPFGPFADTSWARPEVVRLEELHLVARELHAETLLNTGRADTAVAELERLTAEHPHRDTAIRLHVLALYRLGRHTEALTELRAARTRLVEEEGLDPSPQLVELERLILDQDPRLDAPTTGRRLRGYELHEVIATTSVGLVHRATQPSIGRDVGVTVVPAASADDPELVRTFERRAQAVAAVEHPHVLPIYDYWREPGAAYLVHRLPTGRTLADVIAERPLDDGELQRLVDELGAALTRAHESGVMHGRLDAHAVMIDDQGSAQLWAFPLTNVPAAPVDVIAFAELLRSAATGDLAGGDLAVLAPPLARVIDDILRSETGPPPPMGTAIALFRGALSGDTDGRVRVPGPNPYRGLRAFREVDAPVFFGRERPIERVVGRLARDGVVAVVGPSGSGKSSIVRAGVIPRLREDGWYVTTMVPGADPLAQLELALSRVSSTPHEGLADEIAADPSALSHTVRTLLPEPGGRMVLVVDQFEELFTLSDARERELFLAAIAGVGGDPGSAVEVMLTARVDLLGEVLDDAIAGPLVRDRTVLITPMGADELRAAIIGPAEHTGVAVEPGLVTQLIADAASEPGSLPMVQFICTELFESAEGGVMTLADYRRLGGIQGVIGQRAEEVWLELDDDGRSDAERLFHRLVMLRDDGPATRRRVPRGDLTGVPDRVLQAFGEARLLQFDRDEATREATVEVVHEALFHEWPRLATWLSEGADDLRLLGHLSAAARSWDDADRPVGELYRGARLEQADALERDQPELLTERERDFVEASRAQKRAEEERERRRVRRLRALSAGLAVALVGALITGVAALRSRSQERATAEAARGDALAFAASAATEDDLGRAALLAAEAWEATPDIESQAALLDVLTTEPRLVWTMPPPEATCGEGSPFGNHHALTRQMDDGAVADVRTLTLEQVGTVRVPPDTVCTSVDPDATFVYATYSGGIQIIHLETGEVVADGEDLPLAPRGITPHPSEAEGVGFDREGVPVRISIPDGQVLQRFEVEGVDPLGFRAPFYSEAGNIMTIYDNFGSVYAFGRSGDVTEFAVGDREVLDPFVSEGAGLIGVVTTEGILVAPLEAPSELRELRPQGQPLGRGALAWDGRAIAIPTTVGIEIFELPSLQPVGTPLEVVVDPPAMTLTDEGIVYVQSPEGFMMFDPKRVVAAGRTLGPLPPHAPFNSFVARDGSSVLGLAMETTVTDLGTGKIYEVDWFSDQIARTLALHGDAAWSMIDLRAKMFTKWQRGEVVVSSDLSDDLPDEAIREWATHRVNERLAAVTYKVDFESGDRRTEVLVLDHTTGEVLFVLEHDPDLALPYVAEPAGDLVFVGREDASLWFYDLEGNPVVGPIDLEARPDAFGASSDGSLFAIGDEAGALVLFDAEGALVGRLVGTLQPAVYVGFARDDSLLVSRHLDGSTLLWDVEWLRLIGALAHTDQQRPYWATVAEDGESVYHSLPGGIAEIPLDPQAWVEEVCSITPRTLTDAEVEAIGENWTPVNACADRDA